MEVTDKVYFGKKKHKDDIRAAKELCYPQIVIDMLKEEKDSNKRLNILTDARKGVYDNK